MTEMAFAKGEAEIEANKLIQKFGREPAFLVAVLKETANKLPPKHKKENGGQW
jgi:hypothetical protein